MMEGRKPDTQKAPIKKLFQQLENPVVFTARRCRDYHQRAAGVSVGFRGMTGDEAKGLKYPINVKRTLHNEFSVSD